MNDKELYEKCKEYGARARKWKNKFVSLLPEVARRKLYRKHGFCSIYEFAAKLAGVGKDVVDEVMRFDEKFKEMPKLKSLIPEVGLSKLRIVANVAKKDTEAFWANKVQDMTRGALSMYVQKIRPGTAAPQNTNLSLFDEQNSVSESQNLRAQNENKSNFSMQLSGDSIVKLRLLKQKMEKREKQVLCWDEVIKLAADELLSEPEVRIVAQKVQRAPRARAAQRANASRTIPAKTRREMPKVCEVPGCGRPADVIHHSDRWAITHKHENLRSLCKAHHELEHQKKTSLVDEKMLRYLRPYLRPALL